MNKIVLLASLLLSTSALAADVYNCKANLVENVRVVRIEYDASTGVQIDFKKGVPENLIKSKQVLNPDLFNGDYSKLGYHATSHNKVGYVLYTVDYDHPAVKFSYSTEIQPSRCNPNAGYEYQCYLEFKDASGTPQRFGVMKDEKPHDKSLGYNSNFHLWVNAYVDKRDGDVSVQALVTRDAMRAVGNIDMYEGFGRLKTASGLDHFELEATTGTGFQNAEDLNDESQGDVKTDSVLTTCVKAQK